MSDLDDLVQDFLVESYENLERLDSDLVELENDPQNLEMISSVFRTLHTIKGTCGFFGFGKLESITHHGENLLSLLRDGTIPLTPRRVTALLETGDAVRAILAELEETGEEGSTDYTSLTDRLQSLQSEDGAEAAEPAVAPAPGAVASPPPEPPREERPSSPPVPSAEKPAPPAERGSASESSIRVDVQLLDRLMNLVGELVLARNQIMQLAATESDSPFAATGQQLNLITTELQEGVMKTRMQPIGRAWKKYPRVIRDLSSSLGKSIRLVMEGEETELDRTIVEAIQDPMTHIVRNSVDHGIESPSDRVAAGKPEEGTLLLRSYHEGGQVIIEISDDGAGINPEKIRAKAVEKEILSPKQAEQISDHDVIQLICAPGFSTAAAVTNVSGRGVGMDVVKTNIEAIGGAFDIQSKLGEGTTLRIKIPLTLAIIPALVAQCGGENFAIPQVSLLELVRIGGDTRIERVHGVPVFRLREALLEVMFLDEVLGFRPARKTEELAELEGSIILVLHTESQNFGVIVDNVEDSVEIVVKPLARQLQSVPVFSGSTIMGDGAVSLILDVLGLAQLGGLQRNKQASLPTEAAEQPEGEHREFLLFEIGDNPLAMELGDVARLEEIEPERLEVLANRTVVQYRGGIMPIFSLGKTLQMDSSPSAELQQIIVCNVEGSSIGFAVDRICDICALHVAETYPTQHPGMPESFVIQERVTGLVNLGAILKLAGVTTTDHSPPPARPAVAREEVLA